MTKTGHEEEEEGAGVNLCQSLSEIIAGSAHASFGVGVI